MPQPQGPVPTCAIHNVPKVWKEGVSKIGRPYALWSCPQNMPDGSFCTDKTGSEKPAYNGGARKPISDQPTIVRSAIMKSLIEAGYIDVKNPETLAIADAWAKWIISPTPTQSAPQVTTAPYGHQAVKAPVPAHLPPDDYGFTQAPF